MIFHALQWDVCAGFTQSVAQSDAHMLGDQNSAQYSTKNAHGDQNNTVGSQNNSFDGGLVGHVTAPSNATTPMGGMVGMEEICMIIPGLNLQNLLGFIFSTPVQVRSFPFTFSYYIYVLLFRHCPHYPTSIQLFWFSMSNFIGVKLAGEHSVSGKIIILQFCKISTIGSCWNLFAPLGCIFDN